MVDLWFVCLIYVVTVRLVRVFGFVFARFVVKFATCFVLWFCLGLWVLDLWCV